MNSESTLLWNSPLRHPRSPRRWRSLVVTAGGVLLAAPSWPCSVCFGAGDPDAVGFAWGVLILLVPVALVQFLLFLFLWRAVRRERVASGTSATTPPPGVSLGAVRGGSRS